MALGHDVVYDPPVDVSQAKITASVSVRQFLVVEAEKVKDRGVQVVDVHLVIDR